MGIADDILHDWQAAEAALLWQIDLGVDEWLLDQPLNRYDLPEAVKPAPQPAAARPVEQRGITERRPPVVDVLPDAPKIDPVVEARNISSRCADMDALRHQLQSFSHCDLQKGARNMVLGEGRLGAKVMVITEPPGTEEDREGRAFAGASAALFARMFAAIGLGFDSPDAQTALYAAPALPWRTPGGRAPDPQHMDMLHPFLMRHISLAAPDLLVIMGSTPLAMLTAQKSLSQARGQWFDVAGRPALVMAHPAQLLRMPLAKREAWADLLSLKARMTA